MAVNRIGRPRKDAKGQRRSRTFGKAKRGRTKFNDALIPVVKKLVAQGYSDLEIADVLDIGFTTLQSWKLKVPELARAMKRGEELNIKATERAMFQVSQGYAHRAEKILAAAGKIKRVKTEERYAPNVAAGKLILQAKKREEYGDSVELHGDDKRPIEFKLLGLYDKNFPPPKDD